MKNQKKRAIGGLLMMLIGLTACTHQNPLLRVSPETLAMAINHFEETGIQNPHAATCGEMAAIQDTDLKEPEIHAECQAYFIALQKALIKHHEFQEATIQEVESRATWQHYFKAPNAEGKGIKW